MEGNIKIVECLIERCNQCKMHECIECEICWNDVQAIENLVKGYKKIEAENEELKQRLEDIELQILLEE